MNAFLITEPPFVVVLVYDGIRYYAMQMETGFDLTQFVFNAACFNDQNNAVDCKIILTKLVMANLKGDFSCFVSSLKLETASLLFCN